MFLLFSYLLQVNGRKLVTAEAAEVDPTKLRGAGGAVEAEASSSSDKATAKSDGAAATSAASSSSSSAAAKLSDAQVESLSSWLVSTLPSKLSKVKATGRLRSSPAVVTDHESAAIRRMMRLVEQTQGREAAAEGAGVRAEAHFLPKQTLEINPSHPVIVALSDLKDSNAPVAKMVAEQIVDNALVAAGLVDDSRTMLPRLNALLETLVTGLQTGGAGVKPPASYLSDEELGKRRFVSAKEADEAAGIEVGQKIFDDIDAEMKKKQTSTAASEGQQQ